jgi:hypothetical protein
MNDRKLSYHRRFVESQKELKIVQAKLLQAETLNASLQSNNSSCVSIDEYEPAASTIEQRLQRELSEAQQAMKNKTDRHQETHQQLLLAEDKLFLLEH